MRFVFLLIFCVKIISSSLNEYENAKDKVINKGRVSRVKWQLHENEYEDLNHRMFEENEHGNKKVHYTKRKFNIKVENHRKSQVFTTPPPKKVVTMKKIKEVAKPKYIQPRSKSRQANKKASEIAKAKHKLGQKISIKARDIKHMKEIPTVKERHRFYNRNNLDDTVDFHKKLMGEKGETIKKHTQKKVKVKKTDFAKVADTVTAKRQRPGKQVKKTEDWKPVVFEKATDMKMSKRGQAAKKVMFSKDWDQFSYEKPVDSETSKIRQPENKMRVLGDMKEVSFDKAADMEAVQNANLPVNQIQLRVAKVSTASQVHRKPKRVYVKPKERAEKILLKRPTIETENKDDDLTKNLQRKSIPPAIENKLPLLGINSESLANVPKGSLNNTVHPDDNATVAEALFKKVRVLCWILTFPENHNRTSQPIKDTWGKRCNKLLFMSTEEDNSVPTVKLDVKEGRNFLWPKVKAAFQYVHDHYGDQYDWFIRADDDTYMVMENLRYLLADFNPKDPMYFGCRFKHFSPQGFMSGGAGIAVSNGALKKFVSTYDSDICTTEIDWDLENDDVNLGICFNRIGVKAMDSRDVAHKGRFLVFMPHDHTSPTKIVGDKSFWYWKYVYYPTQVGAGCCSDYTISFHYVSPDDMYALEFLIYRIRPFGVEFANAPIPNILQNNANEIEPNATEHNNEIVTNKLLLVADYHRKKEKKFNTTEHNNEIVTNKLMLVADYHRKKDKEFNTTEDSNETVAMNPSLAAENHRKIENDKEFNTTRDSNEILATDPSLVAENHRKKEKQKKINTSEDSKKNVAKDPSHVAENHRKKEQKKINTAEDSNEIVATKPLFAAENNRKKEKEKEFNTTEDSNEIVAKDPSLVAENHRKKEKGQELNTNKDSNEIVAKKPLFTVDNHKKKEKEFNTTEDSNESVANDQLLIADYQNKKDKEREFITIENSDEIVANDLLFTAADYHRKIEKTKEFNTTEDSNETVTNNPLIATDYHTKKEKQKSVTIETSSPKAVTYTTTDTKLNSQSVSLPKYNPGNDITSYLNQMVINDILDISTATNINKKGTISRYNNSDITVKKLEFLSKPKKIEDYNEIDEIVSEEDFITEKPTNSLKYNKV